MVRPALLGAIFWMVLPGVGSAQAERSAIAQAYYDECIAQVIDSHGEALLKSQRFEFRLPDPITGARLGRGDMSLRDFNLSQRAIELQMVQDGLAIALETAIAGVFCAQMAHQLEQLEMREKAESEKD